MTESTSTRRPMVPLLLAALFISLLATILTGVWEPTHYIPEDLSSGVSISIGVLIFQLGPELLATLLLGLLAVAASGGWPGVRAASLRLLGVERSRDLLAARALTHWARASTAAGFLIGLFGVLAVSVMYSRAPGQAEAHLSPSLIAKAISTTLFAPICGLLVGRLILGSFADAARRSAGIRGQAFPLGSDLGLFALLVPPILFFTLVLLP